MCYYAEHDDLTIQSTSLDWIFSYLIKHYGLTTKGANFPPIANGTYKKNEQQQTYYKQLQSSDIDNLKKSGDTVQIKNNLQLTEDEQLSPSFENAIVLWAGIR